MAITGSPGGWVDDGHLLVNTFVEIEGLGINVLGYSGCSVYSPSGQSTGPCALPEISAFQTVTSDSIYAPALGEILSVSTGSVDWMSGDSVSNTEQAVSPGSVASSLGYPATSAVAGNRIIFVSGAKVLAQAY